MTQAAPAPAIDEFLGTTPMPRWRRTMKYWLPLVMVAALVAAYFLFGRKDDRPQYISAPVEQRALNLTVTATGSLRPTNQVQLGSEVSGRVETVHADVNDRVTRGQVLATINTDLIDDQIRQAEGALASAKATIAQAQSALDLSRAQLARQREVHRLSGGRVPAKVEMEQAVATVRRDEASLAAAQANARSSAAQLSSAQTNRRRAVIRAPVSGVVLARQVEQGQTVAASFSTPNMFIIAEDLSVMQLRVNVDEADVARVREGQGATFTVDAYPGRRFPANVIRVDRAPTNIAAEAAGGSAASAAARGTAVVNYEARLSVANPDGLLRPGMTASATIATASTGQQWLVPNAALRFDPKAEAPKEGGVLNPEIGLKEAQQRAGIGVGSRQRIHVVQTDGNLRAIEVITGESDGRMTVVRGAQLRAGMKVATGMRAATP